VDAVTKDVAEVDVQLEPLNLIMGLINKVMNKLARALTQQEMNVEAIMDVGLDVVPMEAVVDITDSLGHQ